MIKECDNRYWPEWIPSPRTTSFFPGRKAMMKLPGLRGLKEVTLAMWKFSWMPLTAENACSRLWRNFWKGRVLIDGQPAYKRHTVAAAMRTVALFLVWVVIDCSKKVPVCRTWQFTPAVKVDNETWVPSGSRWSIRDSRRVGPSITKRLNVWSLNANNVRPRCRTAFVTNDGSCRRRSATRTSRLRYFSGVRRASGDVLDDVG